MVVVAILSVACQRLETRRAVPCDVGAHRRHAFHTINAEKKTLEAITNQVNVSIIWYLPCVRAARCHFRNRAYIVKTGNKKPRVSAAGGTVLVAATTNARAMLTTKGRLMLVRALPC